MGRRAGLCATVVVVSSLLWLLLAAGIVMRPAQACCVSSGSVQMTATISPQATPTKGHPAQQGKTAQNEQIPSWVIVCLLLIGCAILLWIGGLLPWHGRGGRVRFVSRGRERARWLLLAVILAAVLWAIAQVLGWPVWARTMLAGLAAAVPLVVSERRTRTELADIQEQLVDQWVAVSGGL